MPELDGEVAPPSSRPRATAVVGAGIALVVLVVLGAALLARDRSPAHFSAWLRQDLDLSPAVVACVERQLRISPVDEGAIQRIAPELLRREGITSVPDSERQLVGDVLIACSVQPDGSGTGGS